LDFIEVQRNQGEYIVKKTIRLAAAALVLLMTATVGAQDKPAPVAQQKPAPSSAGSRQPQSLQIPLKIQLVLSRYQGEKKLSSVPYLLWVTTGENRSSLRMGVKIPVYSGGGGAVSYNYQDVGTNIDCSATSMTDGTYKVYVTVNDSSVYFPDPARPSAGMAPPGGMTPPAPAIRSFTSTFVILLRDGQTGQYASATDQASGEVLKIDATLNVLK
jgi:hypothetical protein